MFSNFNFRSMLLGALVASIVSIFLLGKKHSPVVELPMAEVKKRQEPFDGDKAVRKPT